MIKDIWECEYALLYDDCCFYLSVVRVAPICIDYVEAI